MTPLRKTLKKVFTAIDKNKFKNIVIGPGHVTKYEYDVIICDETHRLAQYKNIANRGNFKENAKNLELIKILLHNLTG